MRCKTCNKEFEIKANRKTFCTKECKINYSYIYPGVSSSRGKIYKRKLVEEHGGKCTICGYNLFICSFTFHHIDPLYKENTISKLKKYEDMKKEAEKCLLLCANCHRLIHNSMYDVSSLKDGYYSSQTMTDKVKAYMKKFNDNLDKESVLKLINEESNKLVKIGENDKKNNAKEA